MIFGANVCGNVGCLAYQNYSYCNVKDFSSFKVISTITFINLTTLNLIPHVKRPKPSNFTPNLLS